jgi:hypothetical protein
MLRQIVGRLCEAMMPRLPQIPDPKLGAFEVTTDGFRFFKNSNAIFEMRWQDIQRVVAYKRDLITTDLICLELESGAGQRTLIHEEVIGFWEVVNEMEKRLGVFPENWRERIMKPPFQSNLLILHEK